ncbi:MAG: sodium/solute symporter [Acidobacteriaceae bacterium]|nr:sodium/solute symporter [Acidobacteriaceae bacterium]
MLHTPAAIILTAPHRLSAVDLVIVAIYLLGITLFGLRFRKRNSAASADKSLKSYFLANNSIPWWAIALSVVSAETSTLTIISVPGLAFGGNFGFLQIALGYLVGRVVVALLFLPRYFAGEMLTAYQLIDRRFGPALHKVTAGLFLLTRAAAEGVRVFAVSIVVGIAIGTRDVWSIAIICALTLLYTFEGGLAAVIWTDVVQMIIYVGGTLVALLTLGMHVHGGWHEIVHVASAAGKFHWLNFAFNLTQSYTFWAGLLGGTFLTMASHGTDQLMVQRLLAARNLRQGQAALLSSGLVIFVQFAMFLLIGAGLYVFNIQTPALLAGLSSDRLFPAFIVRQMPVGIAGLLIAAILAAAMSNLSAALNSLASTTVVDFYVTLSPRSTDSQRAMLAKTSTIFWALVLFAIAVATAAVGGKGHVVEIGLSIAAVAYGCLLGVFLLGTLTRFATQLGTSIGMVFGFLLNLWLWQGNFPVHLGPITVPHIAFTWYVLIGAVATFAVGALASMLTPRRTVPALLLLAFSTVTLRAQTTEAGHRFDTVDTLINDAIAQHKLPGAVVVIGHNGKIAYEHTYGLRKLDGEPGLDGQPAPAEAMTEDTIFDMASLTKVLATTTAILELHDAGKLSFEAPVEQYLPAFNPQHDPARTAVTVRSLLLHISGEPADVKLDDAWGLAVADKEEGLRRALTTPLQSKANTLFRYSDINFILLGDIIETLTHQPEDVYVQEHVFAPLGMTETRYLPAFKACGPRTIRGAAIAWGQKPKGRSLLTCTAGTWRTALFERIAPTAHDDTGTDANNPDFGFLLRGVVDDPTTRRMGGVAGHAGVFSTAHDTALFAQSLLDKLLHNTGPFPVSQATLRLATTPQQPSTLDTATILTSDLAKPFPTLVPTKGLPVHGLGWDINTAFSRNRGAVFATAGPSVPSSATPSFGHTGFTGTSLWIDPNTDTYVVLLANAIHPRVAQSISHLRGDVATAAALAILSDTSQRKNGALANVPFLAPSEQPAELVNGAHSAPLNKAHGVQLGIDVLEDSHFSALAPYAHIGLLTNQTGLDSQGKRTVDILHSTGKLTKIFTPEHGLFGAQDTEHLIAEHDMASGLPVLSLYGAKPADRHPTHEQLKDLDAVVIDIQDAGVRFFTYETVVGYFLEAAAAEQKEFQHKLTIVVLDRPNPINGLAVQGPVSDANISTYTNFTALPVRHGMTLGELARYFNRDLHAPLQVIAMQNWQRSQWLDQTGRTWHNPSPNLHSLDAATLYPGVAFVEQTNVSVGRGSATPFEQIGAPWIDASKLAAELTAQHLPGVTATATTLSIADDANHYPFHGQTIPAVRFTVTDREALDSPRLGLQLLVSLHHLYPEQFKLSQASILVANKATMQAITRGDSAASIAETWKNSQNGFTSDALRPFLLY